MTVEDREPPTLRAVGRSATVLTVAIAGAQALLIVRDLYVAAQIGVDLAFDALLIALLLPTAASSIILSGASAAFVPAYVTVQRTQGRRAATQLAGTILTWIAIAGLSATIGLMLLADPVIARAGVGFDDATRGTAVGYLVILAPIAMAAALSGVLSALLLAEGRIVAMAAARVAGPLVALTLTIGLWEWLGLGSFAAGALAGAFATLLMMIGLALPAHILPFPRLTGPMAELRAFVRHALPLTVSSTVLQLNVLIGRAIATTLAPGAVSALRYGDAIIQAPIGVTSNAWGQALYPALVGAGSRAEPDPGRVATTSIRHIVAAFVPLSVGIAAMAPQIVTAVYARGAFTIEDVRVTSLVVAAFAPLFLTLMIQPVLVGAHNARRRGGLLLINGLLHAFIGTSMAVVLGMSLGPMGIAAAASIASLVVMTFLAWRLAVLEPSFAVSSLTADGVRAIAASLPPAIPMALIGWYVLPGSGTMAAALFFVGAGAASLVLYVVIARALGYETPATLGRLILRAFTRRIGRCAART
jgi:putative peptidoglycan lipid II flippase